MSKKQHLHIKKVSTEQAPMDLLLEADPSESQIRKYLETSHCYIAVDQSDRVVGVYVLYPLNSTTLELMNIAVHPEFQGQGIGTELLNHLISEAKILGAKRLELGTGTFGYQLAFYQRAGFRVINVERDYFLNNYEEPIFEDGIQHKDRLRLAINL
ncbi:MAG: GNAT family N-acetyltransferase [Balneolaceae bacterium]|nr:GNAT family N-acetyltransferase [Balneolaceae bacterium]